MVQLRVIACGVFEPELAALGVLAREDLSFVFVELGAHDQPIVLRARLQAEIDAAVDVDAVVLLFGLCGLATAGLRAGSVPLVIARAHDCGLLLLGSSERYLDVFGAEPSLEFVCAGNCDGAVGRGRLSTEYEKLVRELGEADAEFVWGELRRGTSEACVLIHTPGEKAKGLPRREGVAYREVEGNLSLVRDLLDGVWRPEVCVVVPPGGVLEPAFDLTRVFKDV